MLTATFLAAVLLQDVTVIDGTGGPAVPHSDILIEGERIAAVGRTGSLPAGGAQVVPLAGRFVTPGFVDMHVHVLNHPWDEAGNIRPRWDRQGVVEMLGMLLDAGVTTIRDPGSETEAAVTWRAALARGEVRGPRLFTAGRIINASDFDPEPFLPVHSEDEARREVRWQAALGVDAVKVYSSTPPALVGAVVDEARKAKLPVIGHLQRTTWTEAAELGIDTLEHAAPWSAEYLPAAMRASYRGSMFERVAWVENVDLGGAEVRAMLAALHKHDVTVDPTLIAMWTKFFGDAAPRGPDIARAPTIYRLGWPKGSFTADWTAAQYEKAQAAWPKLLRWTQRLFAAGIRLTAGTDTPTPWIVPGWSLHDEMALLADASIPPAEVIRCATSNAAAALQRSAEFGTVAAGKRADLVVLARDPLRDIRNTRSIEQVYARGARVR